LDEKAIAAVRAHFDEEVDEAGRRYHARGCPDGRLGAAEAPGAA